MKSEEQRLIDGLFSRLQHAEHNSAPRDSVAEDAINAHLRSQPAAPYYMAQTLLIQEAALHQLNDKIVKLEQQVSTLQNQKPASGGFLAGLFGGGQPEQPRPAQNRGSAPIPGMQGGQTQRSAVDPVVQPSAAPRSGFMAGALQTAAGVAGGVVLGNMLTGLFHNNQPEEIVNIIEDPQSSLQDSAAPANSSDSGDVLQPAHYDSSSDESVGTDYGYGADDLTAITVTGSSLAAARSVARYQAG